MRLKWKSGALLFVLIFGGFFRGQSAQPQEGKKYWVFFRDKGSGIFEKKGGFRDGLELGLSRRALSRRTKVRGEEELIDFTDLPVSSEYIRVLKDMGLEPRVISRWLNSASVVIPPEILNRVRSIPFIKKIQPVASAVLEPMPPGHAVKKGCVDSIGVHVLDYGESYDQNSQIRIPEVHDLGITGKGVLIGMIDTGFDYQGRLVFSHLDVVAEHDFHWDDDITANEENDPSYQHDHGTRILSIIGGFREGHLIGPAHEASFVLAKTEWVPVSDLKIEEEHWVEAIEWMERLGVDVVSSSLGYATFVDAQDYSLEDLDGNTCAATIAADIAVGKGVVVVNSAGNSDFWQKINFPSDGDSVIAVGAVNSSGNLSSFSSKGPTADGRIKPDVVAMGQGVYAVSTSRGDEESYTFISGTSASCPLVAGVCALILQAHPEWGPTEVRDAIRNTASRAANPDTLYGWGLVDAYKAVFYKSMVFMNIQLASLVAEGLESVEVDILSETGLVTDSVTLFYRIMGTAGFNEVKMYHQTCANSQHFRALFPLPLDTEGIEFYIEAVDTLDIKHVGPLGAPGILYSEEMPEAFLLYQNYPNPFNTETSILFDVMSKSAVTLKIFDLLGREVITLVDETLNPGKKMIIWKGVDRRGFQVSSGIYFFQLEVGNKRQTRKMIIMK